MNDYSWNLDILSHADTAEKPRKSTATGHAHYYGDWNKAKQDAYNKEYYQKHKDKWGVGKDTSKEDAQAVDDYWAKAYDEATKRIAEGEDPTKDPYYQNLMKNTQFGAKKLLAELKKKRDDEAKKKKEDEAKKKANAKKAEEKESKDTDSKKKSSGSGSSGSSKKSSGSSSSGSGHSSSGSSGKSSGHSSSGKGSGSGSGKSSSSNGSSKSSGSEKSSGKSNASEASSTSTENSEDKYHAKMVTKSDGDSDFDSSKITSGNKLGKTDYHGFSGKDGRDVVVVGDKKWILPEGRKVDDELVNSLEQFDSYLKDLGSYSEDFYNKAMSLAVEDDMTGLKRLVESEKEMHKKDDEIGHSIGLGSYWIDTVMHDDVDDKQYGIPQQKKFPLDSRQHVISAIKFFNYADPVYRKQLANAIIRKIHEYGITDLTPSDQNAFYKYYHPRKVRAYE